jgi:nucleoside-diphosphate-sugar epimerase
MTTRIAVLGANGQVGSELCLILARQPSINVVPVCRTRMGSAYLRSMGLAVRHGEVADPTVAPGLIGDCDLIANLALVNPLRSPALAKVTNMAILKNVAQFAPVGSRHVYFSTMSVYGDIEVGQKLVLRNAYAVDKRRNESIVSNFSRHYDRPVWIMRLGHVTGELQPITRELRLLVTGGEMAIPDIQRPSNITHVITIAEALIKISRGEVDAGTYDLMNVPQWTWGEVLEYEASLCKVSLNLHLIKNSSPPLAGRLGSTFSSSVSIISNHTILRRLATRFIGCLPDTIYHRIKAKYAIASARRELQKLKEQSGVIHPAMRRVPVGQNFINNLTPTRELLGRSGWSFPLSGLGPPWPTDLAPAIKA